MEGHETPANCLVPRQSVSLAGEGKVEEEEEEEEECL